MGRNRPEMVKDLVRGLYRSGFLEMADDHMKIDEEVDFVAISFLKKMDHLKLCSGRAGFDGLKVKHIIAVADSMGLKHQLANNYVGIAIGATNNIEAVLFFPSLQSNLFSSRPTEGPGPDDLRESPIWSQQFIAMERAQLAIRLRLEEREDEEVQRLLVFIDDMTRRVIDFAASLKFYPKLKHSAKRALKPSSEELSALLVGAGFSEHRQTPATSSMSLLGKQDARLTINFASAEKKAGAAQFLKERSIKVYDSLLSPELLSVQILYEPEVAALWGCGPRR